ncbi:hypothetical protein GGI42DRAFT_329177 [Trichoderma sp. SZMC 28013]
MEISISESLKGPSCTMAAILMTLPSHPSIHPKIHPVPSLYTNPIPPLSVPISSHYPAHHAQPVSPNSTSFFLPVP